jgi:glucose-1-phosphate adenylyltransferase
MDEPRILAFIMAGGKGERLFPLTRDRAKPAVPFGGRYRIIDFVLSNMHNSGIRAMYVLSQYKAQSLVEHIQHVWGTRSTHADFVTIVPAQMRMGESWYRGTADSIHQNFHLVEDFRPDVVVVFGADHVYKMSVRQMVDFHVEKNALATIACLPVPVSEASQFGIVETDAEGRVIGFQEKPTSNVMTIPGDPAHALASMGNYTFAPLPCTTRWRRTRSRTPTTTSARTSCRRWSRPAACSATTFHATVSQASPKRASWPTGATSEPSRPTTRPTWISRTCSRTSTLYNWEWPIVSVNYPDPPSKLVFDDERRRGMLVQSIMSSGCVIAGGFVKDSCSAATSGSTRAPRFATRSFSTTCTWARARASSAPSSTRTCASPPAITSATTWPAMRFATTSAKAASPWSAKPATPG